MARKENPFQLANYPRALRLKDIARRRREMDRYTPNHRRPDELKQQDEIDSHYERMKRHRQNPFRSIVF